jgi:hypothetical protein
MIRRNWARYVKKKHEKEHQAARIRRFSTAFHEGGLNRSIGWRLLAYLSRNEQAPPGILLGRT